MKKTTKKQSSKKAKVRNKKRQTKNIALRITADFLRYNLICLVVIVLGYIILYQYALNSSDAFREKISYQLIAVFGETLGGFFYSNSVFLVLALFAAVFLFNCLAYSILTLSLFNKTYSSLTTFLDSDAEFISFPKSYSDVEIKLRDIKLGILSERQLAAESENRKNDLVMYLAHDLKTPLTSVIGYLTLLQECPELPIEQRAKFTDIALNKAYRLEQLITEFFEITRFNINKVTLEKNRIDLGMMLQQITEEFYPMLSDKGLTVEIDLIERILMFADADKIARVFDNLLKNAVNYSYENTVIRIGARIRGSKVIIKFRNRCDEIPEEKLKRLFDKFYRIDASRGSETGGSGLGLAIAKQIIELHGGTISAKSTTDYTDFTVILPFISAEDIPDEQMDF
ncbi:MAG: HAMP domain-containing sensor histidine kinase [Oscillospiraceae bacterium]|nr:HAMP domain-containing sensor histidine kinase [Oscillospiraceae bacterium]